MDRRPRGPRQGLGGLNPSVASQMALWGLPCCWNCFLEPPGLHKWASGAARAVQMAILSRPGCSNGFPVPPGLAAQILRLPGLAKWSLEPPRLPQWLSGASGLPQWFSLGPPGLFEWLSGALPVSLPKALVAQSPLLKVLVAQDPLLKADYWSHPVSVASWHLPGGLNGLSVAPSCLPVDKIRLALADYWNHLVLP